MWSNFRVNIKNQTYSTFKIGNILVSNYINFLLKLTICLKQENGLALPIGSWKYTLRNLEYFLNSPSLRYSRRILVIGAKMRDLESV